MGQHSTSRAGRQGTVNVWIQGMRRSGTTILFDLLCADPAFTAFYEPLASTRRPSVGGGSGLRTVDLLRNVRAARAARLAAGDGGDPEVYNHGAPRDHRLEFERDIPAHVADYLASLLEQGDPVLIKETRLSAKIAAVARLDPTALLIHAVRDPRAVAASHLFGRHAAHRERYADADAFFGARGGPLGWSADAFSDYLLGSAAAAGHPPPTDVERVLLVWQHTTRAARRGAMSAFGGRYLRVAHEDLRADPVGTLERVYGALDRPLPAACRELALRDVRPPEPPFAADDPRWPAAFDRLGLGEELAAAGYGSPPPAAGSR